MKKVLAVCVHFRNAEDVNFVCEDFAALDSFLETYKKNYDCPLYEDAMSLIIDFVDFFEKKRKE